MSYIVIDKTDRTLSYFKDGQEVLTFPVAFGSRPGQKRRRGDRRTPEGDYRIVAKHGASKFHKFLLLNYPNGDDARRGLDAGLISERDYTAIVTAVENDTIPPQRTRLGGYIGIHGGTAVRIYRKLLFLDDDYDWTLGCIATKNENIDRLYDRVEVGTRVIIK
jgi:murein L,D-transpeptidase YafK